MVVYIFVFFVNCDVGLVGFFVFGLGSGVVGCFVGCYSDFFCLVVWVDLLGRYFYVW